jgi:hypothetical protein
MHNKRCARREKREKGEKREGRKERREIRGRVSDLSHRSSSVISRVISQRASSSKCELSCIRKMKTVEERNKK